MLVISVPVDQFSVTEPPVPSRVVLDASRMLQSLVDAACLVASISLKPLGCQPVAPSAPQTSLITMTLTFMVAVWAVGVVLSVAVSV